MEKLSGILSGKNPQTQMKSLANGGEMRRLGEMPSAPDVVFNPTQRIENQLKSASQVMNYAASKSMAEQDRTDMRGSVMGYAESLG